MPPASTGRKNSCNSPYILSDSSGRHSRPKERGISIGRQQTQDLLYTGGTEHVLSWTLIGNSHLANFKEIVTAQQRVSGEERIKKMRCLDLPREFGAKTQKKKKTKRNKLHDRKERHSSQSAGVFLCVR